MTETTGHPIDQKYHKVIAPLEDIYSLGGPETFKKLERTEDTSRNLIVLPVSVFDDLNTKAQKDHDYGALETAEFIANHKHKIISNENGVTLYRLYEGLDLAVMHEHEHGLKDLETNIKKSFNLHKDKKIEFVTNNAFVSVKLENQQLKVKPSDFLLVSENIVHKGIISTFNQEFMEKLYQNGDKGIMLEDVVRKKYFDDELFINQFINIKGENGAQSYARITCDLDKRNGKIVSHSNARIIQLRPEEYSKKLIIGTYPTHHILGVYPQDMEQYLALQYGLLNPDVSLLFLTGSQGSGKTLLSYVAAIDQILWYDKDAKLARGTPADQKSFFKKIVLLKPNNIMGGKDRDIGFLPGSMYEKIKPHIMPYIDAHNESNIYKIFPFEEMLKHPKYVNDYGGPRMDQGNENSHKINGNAHLPANGEVVEMTYSGYCRGRTFKDTIIIIDEAQNFSPYEVKTIIERAGIGCKIIVTGDPYQLDNSNVSRQINGLTHAIKHFLPMPYSALVHLTGNYRSTMSEDTKSWKVYSQ